MSVSVCCGLISTLDVLILSVLQRHTEVCWGSHLSFAKESPLSEAFCSVVTTAMNLPGERVQTQIQATNTNRYFWNDLP